VKLVSRASPPILFFSVVLFVLCGSVTAAPQPKKIPRIAFLSAASRSTISDRIEAFRQGLRELGYAEGKNILIEYRYADGKLDTLPALTRELIRLDIDVLVTGGPTVTRRAKEATSTIPIVMAQDNDPVSAGLIASLARPGGNITGLSALHPEISGKRLELLKEIVPKLSRVTVLEASTNPGNAEALQETKLAAGAFGAKLQYVNVLSPEDIESAFRAANKGRADAVMVLLNPVLILHRAQIVELAVKNGLPAVYPQKEYVEAGGLISYGVNVSDLHRRAATYVDKILKGAKPTDLPVEQPTKFELVVNLKTAKQIGLAIPPNVLVRADRVIR